MRVRRTAALVTAIAAVCGACGTILDLQGPPAGSSDAGVVRDSTTPSDRVVPGDVSTQTDGEDLDGGADVEPDALATCVAADLDAAVPEGGGAGGATYTALDAPGAWTTFPYASLGVAANLQGGTFDGRYVYMAPEGQYVVRYDTTSDAGFDASSAWQTSYGSHAGLHGAAYDGRFVYFAPYGTTTKASSTAARYDTHGPFPGDSGAWSLFDLTTLEAGTPDAAPAAGYSGATFDGRYVYFVPDTQSQALVMRFDTTTDAGNPDGSFTSAAGWSGFSLASKEAGVSSYFGGVYDGAYVYFVPSQVDAIVARFPVKDLFTNPADWQVFPLQTLLVPGDWDYGGGAFDGRYVYFAPRTTGVVVRYDTLDKGGFAPLSGLGGWSAFDLASLPSSVGDAGAFSFEGAAFDGRFVYFVPHESTTLVRYDTFSTFGAPCAWQTYDLSTLTGGGVTDAGAGFFAGAVFDGQYLYFIPNSSALPALRFLAKTPPSMPQLPDFHGSFY